MSFQIRGLMMKKSILVGLAILAISTSGALAAHKKGHAAKPKEAAVAAAPASPSPIFGQPSAADKALYLRNQRESGVKPEKKK